MTNWVRTRSEFSPTRNLKINGSLATKVVLGWESAEWLHKEENRQYTKCWFANRIQVTRPFDATQIVPQISP